MNFYPLPRKFGQHLNGKRKHFKVKLKIQVTKPSSLSGVQCGELEAQSSKILEMKNAGGRRDFPIRVFFIQIEIGKTSRGDALSL